MTPSCASSDLRPPVSSTARAFRLLGVLFFPGFNPAFSVATLDVQGAAEANEWKLSSHRSVPCGRVRESVFFRPSL